MAALERGEARHRWRRIRDCPTPEPFANEAILHNKVAKNTLRLALGMTCHNRNCLAVDPISGAAMYPASGVVVLLDTLNCRQTRYIQASTHSISCVNFSPDGQYIVLGESGHMPAVRVWSMDHDHQVAEFQGHEYGVAYAAFSGNMDVLVSVGINQDGTIFVWSWPSREIISCNRFAEVIYAMSFSSLDPLFVTCGYHHIRFWYPDTKTSRFETDTLLGRSVIMRDIKTRTYVDVAFGSGCTEKFVYCVTTCGLICKINSDRQITQFHRLHNTALTSVQASDDLLVTASQYGYVHFFNAISMQYRITVSIPMNASIEVLGPSSNVELAELRAKTFLGLDNVHKLLTAILDNGDLCIWDIRKLSHVKRKFFSSGHNKIVSGVDSFLTPNDGHDFDNTMFSISQDGTLRQWQFSLGYRVCCENGRTLYEGNYNPRGPATCETEVITAIKASQLLGLVVVGDSKGLVTVYESKDLYEICSLLRHSRGITLIMFYAGTTDRNTARLMLTGGRDRLINVYDMKKPFQILNTLSLHSGSIAALAMVETSSNLMLLSSGLDRTVILSCTSLNGPCHFTPRQSRHTTSSVIDMQVCPAKHWAVLGRGNAVITIIDTYSFESVRTFRACAHAKGQLEKLCVDAKCALLVTACSDRSISLMNLPYGLRLASLTGHATPVSGLVLTSDMRHMISSSRDGCIFLWQLPSHAMRQVLRLLKRRLRRAKRKAAKAAAASRTVRPVKSLMELNNSGPGSGLEPPYLMVCSRVSYSNIEV